MAETTNNDNIQELKLRIKKYLELENVSVLAGAGTSFHLGAPIIRTIPEELKEVCKYEIEEYFGSDDNPSFEDLLNCLQADKYLRDRKNSHTSSINFKIGEMQNWLVEHCDTQRTKINDEYKDDENLAEDRYFYHEKFIKKLLQRPSNLRRANLFTTNYDMAFDYALDNLGVHYINGFMGVHNRCFRPEVYEYDIYYPGQSVSGKVHRAEKVLKYYKLHGSLSWVSTEATASNLYGIREKSLNESLELSSDEELIIYPCANKKTFTLDLPYSELFRQFSQAITQPQSVLFCIGYSFYDEHINDIIYQALSVPSFTLFIINYSPKANENIEKLKALKDPRIIVVDETDKEQSTFIGFVNNIMPDLYEENDQIVIAETLNQLITKKKNDDNTAQKK